MRGWRPALRIAWRDALRHKGRSILVVVMISLPVLAVSAAAVIITTADVSGVEGTQRTLGAADARIRSEGRGQIIQAPEATRGEWSFLGDADHDDPLSADEVRAALGVDARLLPIVTGWSRARLDDRVVEFSTTGVDLSDPLAAGLFDLERGHLPEAGDEVVVNTPMIAKGFALGDELEVDGSILTIVGVGRDATARDQPVVLGSPDALSSDDVDVGEWLVDAGPVSWSQVLAVNRIGGVVTSRAVLADPPDVASMAEQMGYDTGRDELLAVGTLIIVMALIEVVLLAGPAFAVGARRHTRTLALIAASGGTPAQARRVILGSGVVLGLVASAAGLVLGIAAGWALLPLVQRFNGEWFGPFELPWRYLAVIAAFGLVAAVLASLVPAWLASRQDVVAVLAGRRGDPRPRASTPIVGLVLLGVGIATSAYGAVASDDSASGAYWIGGSAIISVLGMILVVPMVVSTIARLARRLPLTARYAARDAARHRTRTVPAVAAVAATVAGVIALGISTASQERADEHNYAPQARMGTGTLTWYADVLPGEEPPDRGQVWDRIVATIDEVAPGVDTTALQGVDEASTSAGWTSTYVDVPPEQQGDVHGLTHYGPDVAVADTAAELGIEGGVAARVDAALAGGEVVLLTPTLDTTTQATLRQEVWDEGAEDYRIDLEHEVRARVLPWDESILGAVPSTTILPSALADELGLDVSTSTLSLTGDLDRDTETRVKEAVGGFVADATLYVERGYQRPPEVFIVLLVLGALGGVLMLGGTLTATFLALSDARADLATLSAVGAAPRTRRRVAAAYALVIGFVGAVLGAGVGFIPGIAISRPLTSMSNGYSADPAVILATGSQSFLAIPWLLIAVIVVALPLLTAAIVGLTARSRLPLVARLD